MSIKHLFSSMCFVVSLVSALYVFPPVECLAKGAKTKKSIPIKMITWNIRYSSKVDTAYLWNDRGPLLMDFLKREKFDIFCLQEITKKQLADISKAMTDYNKAEGYGKLGKDEVMNPIFFNKAKYLLSDTGTFWISENPDSAGKIGWDAKYPRRATWAKLQDINTKKEFYIVNTHLDHLGVVARQKGMELIKRKMKDIASNYHVILCGDMNTVSNTKEYYIALNNQFFMYDVYHIAKERKGVTYSFHGFGKSKLEKRRFIDYIFVTGQIQVESVDIPQERLKNGTYISDHCPIMTTLKLLDKE